MHYSNQLIFIVGIFLTTCPNNLFGQCNAPIVVCSDETVNLIPTMQDLWFSCVVPTGYTGSIIQFTSPTTTFTVKAYGRYLVNGSCVFTAAAACDSFNSVNTLIINLLHGTGYGEYYYFRLTPTIHSGSITAHYLVFPNPCNADTTELPCSDCIPSFNPQPDSSYIISAWIKETNVSVTTTTYAFSSISIYYLNTSHVSGPFHPKGQIIDGWQLLEDTFKVPVLAKQISISLNAGTTSCFDDIRVFPYKGSMKSYVFDPLTLRLVAELDERNYATLYEYDEEGQLIRVKKETERGIMTVQENRSNTSK